MYGLTEQQRIDAIAACDGIEAANDKIQRACKNILEILKHASAPRNRDGNSTEGDLTGEA